MRIFGIVNVTGDSFSDGGRYLDPEAAIAHAEELVRQGAHVIDVGAESTNPRGADVPSEIEIARLRPVVSRLCAAGVEVSVDTVKPAVMREAIALGASWINDVSGMRDMDAVAAVADSTVGVVAMFAKGSGRRAEPVDSDPERVVDEALAFLEDRAGVLVRAGVSEDRIVLDPGMGMFLGRGAAPSLAVLRSMDRFRSLGFPLMVSVSRKGFLGEITGRGVGQRGAATLAAEIWAMERGVDWIRTHDPGALRDASLVFDALRGKEDAPGASRREGSGPPR
ncbi:MAG: dihydropteroate synthase [Planctomycetota bacterium]